MSTVRDIGPYTDSKERKASNRPQQQLQRPVYPDNQPSDSVKMQDMAQHFKVDGEVFRIEYPKKMLFVHAEFSIAICSCA